MRENIRIEKELLFKNNIKDITSISIDCDYKKNEQSVIGNFIISGEYKIHEISLNKEKFNFKIPFTYELDKDIDTNSVSVDITNFIYDYKKDELLVNIEYEIVGDRKEVLVFDDEESLDDFLNSREIEVVDTRIEEIKEQEDILKEEVCIKEENKEEKIEELETIKEEKKENIKTFEEEINSDERDNISSEEVISNVGKIEDSYVTYKIYKIKENDTLENLVIKYKTTIDELKEYNDINNLNINDKLIIPNE